MSGDRGGFIWYELIADDVDRARRFYRAVVGWEIADEGQAMPTGTTYRMIQRSDGGNAGGVLTMNEDMKAHGGKPGWLGYLHHPDVDAAIARIEEAGGQTHMPAMDMPGVGRMAMVSDPQGAVFYVMNPTPPEPGAKSDVFDYAKAQHIRWNELWTTDQAAAVALYTELFGWTQEGAMPMGPMGDYLFIQHDGGGIGAIAKAQPGGEGSRWQYFAGVDDIDRACRAVGENGGALLGDPQQIPGGEYTVYAHDPSGATIGLVGREWRHDMEKLTTVLWFDGDAEEAARFYAATFPDSAVAAVFRAPSDFPSGKKGDALTVAFTVLGRSFSGLNGGDLFKPNESVSFMVVTEDQAETDRYWNAIVGNGGEESACGWCKDKWGFSWQITPRTLLDSQQAGGDEARRAFEAMMTMHKIDVAKIDMARRGG